MNLSLIGAEVLHNNVLLGNRLLLLWNEFPNF